MNKYKEIRPIVLGLAIKNNKILVQEGFDKISKKTFYRCLGGGIEFLENKVVDDNNTTIAKWIDIEEFKESKKILYPKEVLNYI